MAKDGDRLSPSFLEKHSKGGSVSMLKVKWKGEWRGRRAPGKDGRFKKLVNKKGINETHQQDRGEITEIVLCFQI